MSRRARRTTRGTPVRAPHRRRRVRSTRSSPLLGPTPSKGRAYPSPARISGPTVRTGFLPFPGVTCLSALIGASAGAVLTIVDTNLHTGDREDVVAPWLSATVGVLALLGGVFLPRPLVLMAAARARRGLAEFRDRSGLSVASGDAAATEASFRGLAVATMFLFAGVVIALLPEVLRVFDALRGFLFDHFVWSWPALAVLNFLHALGAQLIPLLVLGAGLAVLWRSARRPQHRGALPLVAAFAAGAGAWVTAATPSPALAPITALPLLLTAAVLGWYYTRAS